MTRLPALALITAAAASLALPGIAVAAGAIEGGGVRDALNWPAIVMFLLFVAGTLFITKWAASRTKSAADFYTAGGTDQLAARIAATRPKVDEVLAAIHSRSPQARIYVAGYPAILPESDQDPATVCWPQMPITTTDVAYLRGVEKQLNQMLADAAAANGASYVDTYTPTIGHDACKAPVVRYVEPLAPVGDAAPVHPNRLGAGAMGGIVAGAMS